jgi:FkbM family methyltransferase
MIEPVIIHRNGDPTLFFVRKGHTDHISTTIRYSKQFYEYGLLEYIHKNYNSQKTIIDIGAHIGNYSVFFAKYLDCDHVISFEPFPKNFTVLKKNMADYKEKCILHNTALSHKRGSLKLYNRDEMTTETRENNFIITELYLADIIDVLTLDMYRLTDISMIKIDVENHENDVLLGAKNTIIRNKPLIFIINSNNYLFPESNSQQSIMDELQYVKKEYNICESNMDLWVPIDDNKIMHTIF